MRGLGLNYSSDETTNSYMRRENVFAFREERPASRSRRLNLRRPWSLDIFWAWERCDCPDGGAETSARPGRGLTLFWLAVPGLSRWLVHWSALAART
jgi:hypothetical protein